MKRGWGIGILATGCAVLLTAVVRLPEPAAPRAFAPADVDGEVMTEIQRLRIPVEARPDRTEERPRDTPESEGPMREDPMREDPMREDPVRE